MKNKVIPFLLILPVFIFLLIFVGIPIFEGLKLAFENEQGAFENFKIVFSSREFKQALWNTLLLSAVIIPIQFVLALALALLINKKMKGYRTLLYIIAAPLALSDVTAGLISYSIFAPNGYLNKFLINFNLIERPIYFFGYMFRDRAFWVIVLTEVWRATPLVFVILLAGLQSINAEYLEASQVFGFSPWKKLTKIILPMLTPSIISALLIRTLFAFQIFGVVWLLAGRDIPVLTGEAYYWWLLRNNRNIASVYAMIIAFITFVVGYFYIKVVKSGYLEEGEK